MLRAFGGLEIPIIGLLFTNNTLTHRIRTALAPETKIMVDCYDGQLFITYLSEMACHLCIILLFGDDIDFMEVFEAYLRAIVDTATD